MLFINAKESKAIAHPRENQEWPFWARTEAQFVAGNN